MVSSINWSLGRRITALCATVAILLGLIAFSAALTAVRNRSAVRELLDRTGPARYNAEKLMAAVVNEQASVRGYGLSGEPSDLVPYTDGVRNATALIASIKAALAKEPALLNRLHAVETLIGAWQHDVAEPVIASVQSTGSDPAQTTSPAAKAEFAKATDAVSTLQQALLDRRNVLTARINASGNLLIVLLFCAAAVVFLAGIALAVLLSRLVTRPVVELAEEVRQVASGDYEREIRGDGPPEVAGLARDVDVMRQRIAEDLAEVRAARLQVEEANRQLQAQTAELTRSNRDLEQFAYVASHDLQEPLRKVASFCQLLQRRYAGNLDERADQYIAFAVDGAQRMQRLINDLLAFSRIGRLTTGFAEIDLNELTAEAASQLDLMRAEAKAKITWDPLPTVRGEEPLLLALVTNLISNSLKFRRPDVPCQIHFSARQVGNDWDITCRDNGIGIGPEFADKVFVIFQRLHAKERYPGTGIGLAIAKKIIEYHDGHIWLDTEYCDGTLIHFTLPVTATARRGEPDSDADHDGIDHNGIDHDGIDRAGQGGAGQGGAGQGGGDRTRVASPSSSQPRPARLVAANASNEESA